MAKQIMTFDEAIYNQVVSGKKIWHGDLQKEISHVKLIKNTRQIQVFCVDGTSFLANQDDEYYFEVTTIKESKPVTIGKPKKARL